MLETGEQATGGSNQKPLLELPNSACSTAHHEEASKSVEDGNSIGIQGACTSRNTEAIQCDETWSCGGKGCKRHYHLSCMDPSLDVSLGIWLCIMCMKKRIQFGVYSVSEGIESLWDVKEGVVNSKQYFVKYKNLAHVHNQWVSESDIVDSTPQGSDLISKVSKKIHKEKTIRWKQEWAEPHRLLKRRLLMPQKEAEVFFNSLGDKFVYCNVEWLVKWKDLGYEHATWELESSSFLCTPEAEELKRSYEDRFKTARKASDPSKVDKAKGGIFQQLERLPDGCPPGLDDDHLRSLNQLREFWHNSCGAIFIDDQERVIKTILFVASILPHICQPLLIVSTTTTLSLWETKFNRLAASINVVVYNGEKDVRKSIQDLEFYQDGSVMLQVLLSHPDAILEDIEVIERINWEAVIVDDCQNSRVSKWLEQLRRLPTNFRMVLLSSSLKESIAEHISLLSFLNPEENGTLSVSNGVSFDTAGTLVVLKEKLARYVAFERKTDSSKLLEYWVPARLSPVQLEMYCYILLSNSPALRSHSKTDSVGALRNILISLRKCCDHPYLVDQSLQSTLTKDHPVTDILDIGVRSCGKLLLLDRMLQQIRIQGLRVLILSQSGGESGKPMGDILDDFVRQRFGYESYERVERGLLLQKKQTAMNMFNDKTKGRFIFLIDSRACGPSIKLSSVDAIIIYCSDWNPMNDLRALQRVSMESQSEPVPIFRLYSSFTVEEKALILAKHDHILDSNIVNITPSLSHCLLSWGASFLFNRLEELQQHSYSNVSGDELFMDNVDLEFLTKLLSKVELRTESGNTAISQAYLCGSFYSRAIVVAGEREGIPSVDGDLPKFWAYWLSLLNGRSPQWQYISEPVQRSRRKINNMEQQLKNTDKQLKITTEETDEARVKRRRIGEIMDSSAIDSPGKNKDTILPGNNTPPSSHQISVEDTWQELERSNLHATQKGLHVQLKPEISKLYKLLQLPEKVKSLCEEFLEYILKNHQISQEPKGILHAFNLALCWRAASLSKHKINHTESLALAVKNLNYECKEELVDFVYGKLKILKKKFARRAGEVSKQNYMVSVSDISTCEQVTSVRLRNDELVPSQVTLTDGNFENGSHHEATGDFWTEEMVSGEKELLPDPVTHEGEHLLRDELLSKIMDKRIKLVDKVFSLRGRSIYDKHSNQVSFLDMHRQKVVDKLRRACSLVVEHLRSSQNHIAQEDRDGKIKLIIEWFTMLLYAFLEHMKCQRNRLDMQQSASRIKESQLKEETLQAARCGQLDQNFDQHIPSPDFEFAMEEFRHFREVVGSCYVDPAALVPESLDDNSAMEIMLVQSATDAEVIEEVLNRPTEVLVQGPASEVVGPSVDVICNCSDGINSQRDASLAVHSLEPSSDDLRSTDHVEENTVGSQIQGGTSKHLGDAAMEVETGNRNTALADSPHFDKPALTAPSRQATLLVSRETEMLSNLVDQCAQQSLVSAQPLQDESEQADLSSAASTQPLQSERQQLISVSNNLLERAQLDQSQPNYQTDAAPGCAQSTELFPVTSMMFNHAPIDSEPLKNELHKLRLHMDTLNKVHEMKKTQLQTACSQELEKVKRKYDLLIKEHDSTHLQQKKALGDFYEKVQRNQSLAEDFRAKFISLSAAQGAAKGHTPPVRHTPQATQVVSSTSSIALSSACRPPVPRPRVQAPQVDQPLLSLSQFSRPSLQVVQPPNLELGNLFRATSTTLSHMPPQRGSYGVQSELAPRSPAPHLQFRSPRAHSMAPGNQQQSPAISVDAMSSRTQPVLAASTSPSDIHVGPLAASALSSLHSVLPSTSLPSSLHPSHLAQRVPPTPNPTLQAGAPKGSNATMPSIPTGMQLPDSGSLSLDAWLTANLGLNDASTAPAKDTASLGLSSDAPRAAPDTNTASLGLSSDVPRGTAPATNTASLGLSSDVPRGTTPATTTTSLGLISDSPRVIAPASSNSPGAIASATNGGSEIDVVCLSDDE
ncbi:Helicase protein MOM1 [Zea mays]|uniref:Helicase protein MOM1 n=1 Tax=Zea mays TaxID=4577 RepID=A0A1D6NXY6_MAIZE|nr:Helicase protein MOM1 [Zea mays]